MSSRLGLRETSRVAQRLTPENPWPGLASYGEADSEFFNGRAVESERLERKVARTRLTVLFAPSGLGKTSLLQAGLFPRLRRNRCFPIYVRVGYEEGSDDPTRQTLDAVRLQAALHRVEAPRAEEGTSLWEYFHRRDAKFWDLRNKLLTPIVVFDQFEEIFTHEPTPELLARSRAFLSELADLIEGRPSAQLKARFNADPTSARGFLFNEHPFKVVLSLREDFLPELEELTALMPSLAHNRMRLGRLGGREAVEVVRPEGSDLVDPAVAEQIVRIAAGKQQEGLALEDLELDPPILSVFCRELNEARLHQKMPKISAEQVTGSSAAEILRRYYERCMELVGPATRSFVEDHLLTKSGKYRDSVDLDNLAIAREEIDALVGRRLLRIEETSGRPRLELAHDVLTEVVRESRDRRKLREDRDRARQAQADAEERAAATRRKARLVVAVVALAALVLVIGSVSFMFRRQAQREAARASLIAAEARIDRGQTVDALAFLAHSAEIGNPEAAIFERIQNLLLYRAWGMAEQSLKPEGESRLLQVQAHEEARMVRALYSDGTLRELKIDSPETPAPLPGPAIRDHDSILTIGPGLERVVARRSEGDAWLLDAGRGEWKSLGAGVELAVFDDNGDRLLFAGGDGPIRVLDLRSEELISLEGTVGKIHSAVFRPGGAEVVIVSGQKAPGQYTDEWTLQLRSAADGVMLAQSPTGSPAGGTARFSRDGRSLLFLPDGGYVVSRFAIEGSGEATSLRQLEHGLAHPVVVNGAWFNHDGSQIVTATEGREALIWRLGPEPEVRRLLEHGGPVQLAAFDDEGKRVVTASGSRVRLWDVTTGAPLIEPLQHSSAVAAVEFLGSDHLVTASEAGELRIWRFLGGHEPRVLPSRGFTYSAEFGPDGTLAIASWGGGKTWLWGGDALGEEPIVLEEADPKARVSSVSFTENGARVVTATWDGSVTLWDPSTGARVKDFRAHESAQCTARADHLGSLVVVVCGGHSGVWEWRQTEEMLELGPGVRWAEFAPDNRQLVAASADGSARIWDLETRRATLLPHLGVVHTARFSREGRWVVTASQDGQVRLWSAADGSLESEIDPGGSVRFATFDPASTASDPRVAIASEEGARVWWARQAEPSTSLMWHGGAVRRVTFSADGSRLLTISEDNSAQVWDAATGHPITPPLRHDQALHWALFDPTARRVVTCPESGDVRLWDLLALEPSASRELIWLAEAVAGSRANNKLQLVEWPAAAQQLRDLRSTYREKWAQAPEFRRFLDRLFRQDEGQLTRRNHQISRSGLSQ